MTSPPPMPVIRKNLIEHLSFGARQGINAELFAWPDEDVAAADFAGLLAKAMAAAREILRLYPWPPTTPLPPDHPRAQLPYPWRAVTHDQLRWRPVGPEWEPNPRLESLRCAPRDDPPAFLPDLRFDALDFLYWLAAMRDASTVSGAMVAGWRAACARGRLRVELELRDVLSTGLKQRINAARKGGQRVAKRTEHEAWLADDEALEAAGVRSPRDRAARLAPRHRVSENHFRNTVAKLRKKMADKLA